MASVVWGLLSVGNSVLYTTEDWWSQSRSQWASASTTTAFDITAVGFSKTSQELNEAMESGLSELSVCTAAMPWGQFLMTA